ncbi:MAG: hypothetical protein ABIG61_07945 [Planctomycetota bacterium]
MKSFTACLVTVTLLFLLPAKAAVLEVGLSGTGYAYPDIQQAYQAASSGDTILVHAGLYTMRYGTEYSLNTGYDYSIGGVPTVKKENIVIRAAGDGPAIMTGIIGLQGTAAGVGNITIDGLYVNPETVANKVGVQINPASNYMAGCTIRNVVVYGTHIQRGVYLRDTPQYQGQHLIEHCTFYNVDPNGSYKGLDDRIVGTKTAPMVPIMRSNISVGFDTSFYTWGGGPGETFAYSDAYNWITGAYVPSSYKGTGSVELDPLFYSLDPNDPYFLYLSNDSPSALKTGAHDGTYMGALPVLVLECGDWGYSEVDINRDCYVNLADLAIFVSKWLECTDLTNPECN